MDNPRPNRIEMDVDRTAPEIIIVEARRLMITVGEEMTFSEIFAVEVKRVAHKQIVHGVRQIFLLLAEEDMEMVGHQTEREYPQRKLGGDFL